MIKYAQYVKEHSKEEAESIIKQDPCYFCPRSVNKDNITSSSYKLNGYGSTNPDVMVVSDFVRRSWIKANTYFSGPITPLLRDVIVGAGFDINKCYFTSLVRCSTCKNVHYGEDTKPKKEEVTYCANYLSKEIDEKKPKVIVACGQTALEYFFPKAKLSEKRCQIIPYEHNGHNCVVVPIYNPESMVTTSEFDDIIKKAFCQAYNYIYNRKLTEFPEVKYIKVTTLDLLRQVAQRVKEVERIAYDLETNSIVYKDAKILSIGVSWAKNTAVSWPLWVKDEEECNKLLDGLKGAEKLKLATKLDHNPPLKKFWKEDEWEEVIKLTKSIFEDTTCKKGGHNTFFDNLVLHYNGIEVNNYCYDTMIMKHLLDEEREKSLDYCSWIYTDKGGYKMEKEVYLKSDKSNYANIPIDVLLEYNAGDAAVTFEIYDVLRPRIIAENLVKEMAEIRIPLQKALMKACIRGMRVNREYIRKTDAQLTKEIKELEEKLLPTIKKYYGEDVHIISTKEEEKLYENTWNINSSDCLRDLLFTKMKLKSTSVTSSGAKSTDESTLLKLQRNGVEVADIILQRKKKFKFKTTYINGIEDLLDEDDRIHPSFNVCGTTSGRLSSSNINVQQIPRDKTIKRIFEAPEGYEIGEVDFSQAELRVMAALSNDITMKRIYDQDRDLHLELASTAFNKPISDISKEERTIAKTINFLIGYAGGPDTLKANLSDGGVEISKKEAEKLISAWHSKFKDASSFLNRCNSSFLKTGLLCTPWGRRRRLHRLFSDDYINAAKGREGQNFIIQGFAAELAFKALIDISNEIGKYGGYVISTVHDSILLEYPTKYRKEVAQLCKKYTWITCPELNGMYMKSDFECAKSWGDKKPIDWDTGEYKED